MCSRMRCGFTCKPAAASASACTAPWALMKRPAHSASSDCQLPRPRSCSCAMSASSAATRCGVRCAAASATMLATGLRLCGNAVLPPRPAPVGSFSSPISPWLIKARSRANLPSAPTSTPTSQPSATQSSRWVCQAPCQAGRPSCCDMCWATAGPCSPSVASVPTAPPNCSCSARAAAACSRCWQRTSGPTQPITLKPKLTTEAGCINVRPMMGVATCCSASASSAALSALRSSSIKASARRVSSTIAVSITSWLVPPQCTTWAAWASNRATVSVRRLTIGMARLPARPLAATRAGTSYSSARHTPAMAVAASGLIRPTAASARASAASKSIIACITDCSPNTASICGVDKKPSNAEPDMPAAPGAAPAARPAMLAGRLDAACA